jgi:Flp pilus assembly protein TadD
MIICIATVLPLVCAAGVLVWMNTDAQVAHKYVAQGQKYLLDNSYEEAVLSFNSAIETDPKAAKAYIGLADTYAMSGESDKMMEILRTGIAAAPDSPDIRTRLTDELLAKARAASGQDAVAAYSEAIELDAQNADAYMGLANACLEINDIEKAVSVLQKGAAASDSDKVREMLQEYSAFNTRGNIPGNITNMGLIARQGDWMYYSDFTDEGKLYKMRSDGTEKTKLSDQSCIYINVMGRWVYFQGDDGLYKTRTDGKKETRLNNDVFCSNTTVAGEWIYYINCDDEYTVYRIRTDGTERSRLNDDYSGDLNVEGDWIYYLSSRYSPEENRHYNDLTKMRTDGTQRTPMGEDGFWLNVADGWIYYSNESDDGKLYKIRTDGTDKTKLNDERCGNIIVYGDWVFYESYFDEGYRLLCRIGTDGTERTVLDDACDLFNVTDGWIYKDLYSGEWEKISMAAALPGPEEIDIPKAVLTDVNERGNTPGNIVNRGLAAGQGGYVYFSNYADDGALYRMKSDGSERVKLVAYRCSNISVLGEWVYYINSNNGHLYRVRTDGTEKAELADSWCWHVNVMSDWIYYCCNVGICKMRLDGTEKTTVCTEQASYANVIGDWIYFAKNCDMTDVGIFKIRKDGTGYARLSRDYTDFMTVADGSIYYMIDDHVYKISTGGSRRTLFLEHNDYYLNMYDGWVYYGDGEHLRRIRLDGTQGTVVADHYYYADAGGISVVDGWIYCFLWDEGYTGSDHMHYYRIRPDGSDKQPVE